MMKHEFEKLALRGDGARIGYLLYDNIERFYMSDNDYHRTHGGINETKQDFVKRVFGGKVNTPRTIIKKIAEESIRDNRYALRGNPVTEDRLSEMDDLIRNFYNNLLKYNM